MGVNLLQGVTQSFCSGRGKSNNRNRIQAPSKRSSSGLLYPASSVKERNRKSGKCKISWVLQLPVSCTQASPKVEAGDTPKQAQHLGWKLHQGLNTLDGKSIRASLIPGEWVSQTWQTSIFTSPSTKTQGST